MAVKQRNSKNVRTTRLPKAKLAPKALALKERGWTTKNIAKELGRSERYVWELLRWARDTGDGMVLNVPDAIRREDLAEEVQPMVGDGEEAFELFFNKYSGRTLQPVHKEWVRQALSSHRVLINCPPRHAKSTIFSVWFPIWLIAKDRNVQILICSQTDKLAKKFTNEISYHLSYNQDLIKDFGRFKPELGDWPWRPNSGELLVDGRSREVKSGDLTVQVRGSGQQILGMEANWIVVDDPVSRGTAYSEAEREKLSAWFHGDVMSRLEPNGKTIVIGQRLHLYDLYGELADQKMTRLKGSPPRWKHINYPAVLKWPDDENKKGEVLWPEKWGFTELMEVYEDVGSQMFEAMYQQNPLPEGQRLALPAWIFGDDAHRGCADLRRKVGEAPKEDSEHPLVRVVAIDPSPTRLAGFVVADVPFSEDVFELSVLELKHEPMNVRTMISEIQDVLKRYYPVDYLIFEQNAAQRWLLQDPEMDRIRAKTMVIPHTTGKNKGDPTLGVGSLAMDFEYGRIRLPWADAESKAMSQMLLDEAFSWPQGQTDDLLMALWFIKFNYIRLVPRRDYAARAANSRIRIPPRLRAGYSWLNRKVG